MVYYVLKLIKYMSPKKYINVNHNIIISRFYDYVFCYFTYHTADKIITTFVIAICDKI